MSRTCAFCGGKPVTAEHVWPRWARHYVAAQGRQRHERVLETVGRPELRDAFYASVFAQTVKAVCAPRNTGWMSWLEQRAQPLLTDLMAGRSRELTRSDHHTLAAWAAKTTFVAALAFAHSTGITGDQRRYIAATGAPPPRGAVVWLGAYAGSQPGQFYQRGMAVSLPGEGVDDDDEPNVWTATLSLGPVLFWSGPRFVDT